MSIMSTAAGPEVQVHGRGTQDVAEEHEDGGDEEGNLDRAAQGDAHAQVEPVFAGAGECRAHFGRAADEGDDDEAHEGLGHPEVLGGLLYGGDEDFAHQGDEDRDGGEDGEGEGHRPGLLVGRLVFAWLCVWLFSRLFIWLGAGKKFAVGFQREQQAQGVCGNQEHGQAGAEFLAECGGLC